MNRKIFGFLLPFLACSFLATSLTLAQDEERPTAYHVFNYMKVKPGMHEQYLKLEAAWEKIHIEAKAKGIQSGWALMGILSPSGTSTEYNYVTRNTFLGEEKLGDYLEGNSMMEDWQSLLSDEEIEIVGSTNQIRDLVKTEIYTAVSNLWAEDGGNANIRVFNFFDIPEGKTRYDYISATEKIWIPVHKDRIDKGLMKGWVNAMLVTPYGSAMPYQFVTVDFYTSIEDMLNTPYAELIEAAHPGKGMDKVIAEWEADADLVKSEIRILIDQVN